MTEHSSLPVRLAVNPGTPAIAETPAPARIPGEPGRLARYEAYLIGGVAVLAFVAVWELVASRLIASELLCRVRAISRARGPPTSRPVRSGRTCGSADRSYYSASAWRSS